MDPTHGQREAASGEQAPIRSAFADDPDMAELVQRFVADLPARIASMRAAAADDGDGESFGRLAHHLKGAAGGYGFPQLTEAAALVEDALRDGRRSDAMQALDHLAALARRVRDVEPS